MFDPLETVRQNIYFLCCGNLFDQNNKELTFLSPDHEPFQKLDVAVESGWNMFTSFNDNALYPVVKECD